MNIRYLATGTGFIAGFIFGSGIGIAGGFGAINGAWVVGLIGGYIGWTVAPSKKNARNTKNLNQSDAIQDIELTLLRTYKRLKKAARDPELLTRSMKMGTALSACGGAVRDVYGVPIEDDSIAMHLLAALKSGDYDLIERVDRRIMEDLSTCPDVKSANKLKINYIIHLLAPSILTSQDYPLSKLPMTKE